MAKHIAYVKKLHLVIILLEWISRLVCCLWL